MLRHVLYIKYCCKLISIVNPGLPKKYREKTSLHEVECKRCGFIIATRMKIPQCRKCGAYTEEK